VAHTSPVLTCVGNTGRQQGLPFASIRTNGGAPSMTRIRGPHGQVFVRRVVKRQGWESTNYIRSHAERSEASAVPPRAPSRRVQERWTVAHTSAACVGDTTHPLYWSTCGRPRLAL